MSRLLPPLCAAVLASAVFAAAPVHAPRRPRHGGPSHDRPRRGGARPKPTRHDLKEALDSVLAGKKVDVAETPVDGCVITRYELPKPSGPVTFAEHVAPIIH